MAGSAPLPRVTPHLVDRAATMCARRLRLTWQGQRGNQDAFTRGRVRDPLVQSARAAHHEMGPPNPASFVPSDELIPEEQALFERAAAHYLDLFGDDPARSVDHEPFDKPVEAAGGDFMVGGWIDLVCEAADGTLELRQFELWGRRIDADPLSNPTLLLASLRIRKELAPPRLRLRLADLVEGRLAEHEVEFEGGGSGKLGAAFSKQMARLRSRVAKAEATPGMECGTCAFVPGCLAHR